MEIKRFNSIDVMRSIAIILMVQVHFVQNFSQPEQNPLLYCVSDIFGSLAAPFFTFLVGVSLAISLTKQYFLGKTEQQIAFRTIKRAFFIFLLGLVFAVAIWSPEDLFDWDILTFIGFSILILFLLRKISFIGLSFIAVIIILISPPLRDWAKYFSYWEMSIYPPDFNYDFTFRDVFLGFWINGYFPVFPWLVFPLIGFGIGNWLMAESGEKKNRHLRLLLLGLILIVFSIVGTFINSNFKSADIVSWYASELEFYPATTTFVLGSLGITIVFFWVLHRLFDFRQASGDWLIFFRRYSRFSLTTYVIHHAIHLWPLWLAGILLHNEKMYYYANITTPIIGLILAVAFIIFFYIVLIFWDRSKYKYSLEWIQYRFIE